MGILDRLGIRFGSSAAQVAPKAAYFQGKAPNPLMVSWNPQLREHSIDVQMSWEKAAARAIEGIQNSGFLTRVVEVETGSVVGQGLRLSSRPDSEALGWDAATSSKWSRMVERRFQAWSNKPYECDAAGKMTFGKMQQAAFASYKAYGEVLALMPLIRNRPGSMSMTKVLMLPPSRLAQTNDDLRDITQGVRNDAWGLPIGYVIKKKDRTLGWVEEEIAARDLDGRPNVIHVFDAAIATNRGISPMAPILKVVRQVDQYADATLTAALIQTIFAATIKTNITGLSAFDGLMTNGDTGALDLNAFATAAGEWYDGAQINLNQHGRIAHLMPGDELNFTESKQSGMNYDHFMGWLMREIAAGAGVTYESATGDYRGATYSSIRMGGAIEWMTVLRRRSNIIAPFCQAVYESWLEEMIATEQIDFPGGYFAFLAKRDAATRASWNGPAQPQADDFKAARSHEVLKDIQGTTLSDIAASYGRDWEDDMRQRAEENRLAEELDLPLPWAPSDPLETREGQGLALNEPASGDGSEKRDSKPRQKSKREGDGRDSEEDDPTDASAEEMENGD